MQPIFIFAFIFGLTSSFLPSSYSKNSKNSSHRVQLRFRRRINESQYYDHAAIASEVPECSIIGKNLLKLGGSAMDSAIGTALCIGSINSFASGIGGGGFLIVRTPHAGPNQTQVIDFREVAPQNISESMYRNDPKLAQFGGLAVAVPGELRGFQLAHKLFGTLPWSQILDPVIELNTRGFTVSQTLATALDQNKHWIVKDQAWCDTFCSQPGSVLKRGDTLVNLRYAKTLQTVATFGVDALYLGDIGRSLVRTVQANGGTLSMDDLSKYRPVLRLPVESWYKGRRILTSGTPGGGHVLAFMLNILEKYNLNPDLPLTYHRIVEAMRFGFAARSELGDPQFIDIKSRLVQLVSKQHAAQVRRNISDSTTFPPEYYHPMFHNAPSHGTTHVSVIDTNGMAVSLTSTINTRFGSRVMDPASGIILNNEMDDFSYSWPNFFGLPSSPSNKLAGMKRPQSSTCPTIVEEDGELQMVVGGSGGSRILTSVLQTIVNHIDYGWSITQSVVAPRMHNQLFPNKLEVESEFPSLLLDAFKAFNHTVEVLKPGTHESVIQAIARAPLDSGKFWEAVSDYRKGGAPAGY